MDVWTFLAYMWPKNGENPRAKETDGIYIEATGPGVDDTETSTPKDEDPTSSMRSQAGRPPSSGHCDRTRAGPDRFGWKRDGSVTPSRAVPSKVNPVEVGRSCVSPNGRSRVSTNGRNGGRTHDTMANPTVPQKMGTEARATPTHRERSESIPTNPSVVKLSAFMRMCTKHKDFLMASPVVDKYLCAIALTYMERARLTDMGYTKDRYFFYALFLAMEMEEDAVDGLIEIVYYVVGSTPRRSTTPGVLSEEERRWNDRLMKFYQGKDRFWNRMDHKTMVSQEDCMYVFQHFPAHEVLRKARTESDLRALKTY